MYSLNYKRCAAKAKEKLKKRINTLILKLYLDATRRAEKHFRQGNFRKTMAYKVTTL